MKMRLFNKFLLALFLLTLVPLLFSSITLFFNLRSTSEEIADRIGESVDRQASENLEMRARQIAADVAVFLRECENDLRLVAAEASHSATLKTIYDSRTGEVWKRTGTLQSPGEIRARIPRYASLEIIDRTGRQRFVIQEGRILPSNELTDVSLPANTRFRSETYFADTIRLPKGGIHVSHLSGFHLGKQEQLQGAADSEQAYGGKEYRGVIRFGTPLFGSDNRPTGIAVLSLDHRHLMEFTQHVHPGKTGTTIFPSYKTGNYAFMFDDDGWIITHPNYWDLPGVDAEGNPVPPYSEHSTPEEIQAGRIPFNLDYTGFVHPNYPVVAREVRSKKSGYADTTNVGGARKVMAYAPILYDTGPYRRHGIFGGITIGFQTELFHEPARTAAGIIRDRMQNHLQKSGLILTLTTLLALAAAWRISRGITRPLALLARQVRELTSGSGSSRVVVASGDEVEELAADFNRMAEELDYRNRSLLETLEELDQSRHQVTGERNFMENVLNSISSAILTFHRDGNLVTVNANGRTLLGGNAAPGTSYRQVFAAWPHLVERIDRTVAGSCPFGRAAFTTEDGSHFDVGVFPIGTGMAQGITVTLRDETEKERMREEMTRMDRFASLGKLSAGIAHEIRNPLTGITLLLDDLHDRADLDAESQKMMAKALAEIERVEKLINALLTYAAPSRSEFRTWDLNQVVQDTLLFFRRACEKEGVTLVSRLEELPSFEIDPDKIRQVLLNLLRNSLNATGSGGTITVTTAPAGEGVVITVADTGQGIPEADIPLVFEPFFTRTSAGTGLGLSISERIVEEHHGTIAVASNEGTGTVFTISLPCCRQPEPTGESNHGFA